MYLIEYKCVVDANYAKCKTAITLAALDNTGMQ